MSHLLEVVDLAKSYTDRPLLFKHYELQAVKPLSFTLEAGQTLGIIGQNGSGKSTLAKMLAGIIEPSQGKILINGELLHNQDYQTRCKLIRMIFSDSNSLNPYIKIGKILEGPLIRNTQMSAQAREKRIKDILLRVGLLAEHANFYPQMLSSGQRQRACIARALVLQPSVIIADEASSGLDMTMRAQILNLCLELQEEMGVSFVYISQHIGVIKHMTDQLIVMENGYVVESGNTLDIINKPQHEVTKKLISNHFENQLIN